MLDFLRAGHEARIIKFWKRDIRETIQELEDELIGLSDELDYEALHDMCHVSLEDYLSLREYRDHFITLLSLATHTHQHYQFSFIYSGTPHPNYEKIRSRAHTFLLRISKELQNRKKA